MAQKGREDYVREIERKNNDMEKAAYALFNDALPYYWVLADKYPPLLKLRLALNGYGSAAMACVDIATHVLTSPKLKREANCALVAMQTFVEAM